MQRITVDAPNSTYDIVIEAGLLPQLGERAEEFGLDGHCILGTDRIVDRLYGHELQLWLPNAWLVLMEEGEAHKNLETVNGLYSKLVQIGADRQSKMIALGGGVVGDTMGFVAATYMRGLPFVQIPTTLLAMVDASVGGKVGVDLPEGKNLVGAFKQPDVVLIDTDTLKTLPDNEWRNGMAEVIKHGLLADAGLLDTALHHRDRAEELVRRAVQVKVDVVQQDPYEQNIRVHLNLGHTFAHAIERVTQYQWAHGEAVGVGLLAAAKLSHALGLCREELVAQVDNLLVQTGLPRHTNGLDPHQLYEAMQTDKKWREGRSRFVLLEDVGKPTIVWDVPQERVIVTLAALA